MPLDVIGYVHVLWLCYLKDSVSCTIRMCPPEIRCRRLVVVVVVVYGCRCRFRYRITFMGYRRFRRPPLLCERRAAIVARIFDDFESFGNL